VNPVLRRILILIALFAMGMVVGVSGAFMQAQRVIIELFDRYVILPWGLLIMLALLIALTRLATLAARSRWGAWLFLSGWLGVTVLLAAESPSGDIAVSSGGRQLVYLFGGVIICVAIATFPVNFREGTKSRATASTS
jgi:hypothetical protein